MRLRKLIPCVAVAAALVATISVTSSAQQAPYFPPAGAWAKKSPAELGMDPVKLQEAVDYLNRKMQDIKDQGKISGLDRIAIMAALNIAHEFLATRFGGFDVAEYKRRMAGIETTLDQALADQEKLF